LASTVAAFHVLQVDSCGSWITAHEPDFVIPAQAGIQETIAD